MALETGTYISDLVATNPTASDPKSQGDDHLRLIKSTVQATFPNVSGAVTPTHTELNYVDGVTSAIQTQLNSLDTLKAPLASPTFTGTVTIPSGASIDGFAPLASPALTGVPTAPTAATGTETTQVATTAFVSNFALNSITTTTYSQESFTATASQTAFTPTGGYTAGKIDVYLNGARLVLGSDFTAGDGVTVTLTTGATAGDNISVVKWTAINLYLSNADHLQGGSAGKVPYQTGANFTDFTAVGTTGQVLISNGTAAPAFSSTPSLSGITFPGTQSSSAGANTLDDYEEGTFTPTVEGETTPGTTTYTAQSGRYTKVGNVCTINLYVAISNATGTGNLVIGGLPFAAKTGTGYFYPVTVGLAANLALTASNVPCGRISPANSQVLMFQYPSGGGASAQVPIDTAFTLLLSASYQTD